MDIAQESQFALTSLNKINVLLGKNGCGKSTVLRQVESAVSAMEEWASSRYITPERGGTLIYDASTEQSLVQNVDWMPTTRRTNQFYQFRQQTMAQYRKLELAVLRDFEAKTKAGESDREDFDEVLSAINGLLDNLEIRRNKADTTFSIYKKGTDQLVEAGAISSGESELISLSIECLVFAQEIDPAGQNLLCLDEPDVHLHPDLQARFVKFLRGLVDRYGFTVLIATHSTALLGELADYDHAAIGLMRMGDTEIDFHVIDDIYRKVLPVFGAHPLSNIFNEAPVLLVEGDDDERVWQQAVRSSERRLRLYPVACGSVDAMHDYEKEVKKITDAVYDDAHAFSIRDRDETEGEIDDLLPVVRLKLDCRTAENLLLTDEVLALVDLSWNDVEARIETWLSNNGDHPKHAAMTEFKGSGFDRKGADLKELRMLLVGEIFASNRPWEVLVGLALSKAWVSESTDFTAANSIVNYLGEKAAKALLILA